MKSLRSVFILYGLAAAALTGRVACAQTLSTAHRVADLNPGSAGSFPSNLTVFGNSLYLSAYTFTTGRELWKYDGGNILLLTNINDTADDIGGGLLEGNDSVPQWPTVFNGTLYFSAFDPRRGGELWRHDGTNAFRVADINPDANDTIKFNPNSSWPTELTVFDNALYFSADGGGVLPNYELWKYDGSAAVRVANIHPDVGVDHSSYPRGFTAFNGALYFMADDGTNGYELWKHDGLNTLLVTNLNPGGPTNSSFPKYFTPFNNALYFQAFHAAYGSELWRTDGRGVSLVADLNPGTNSSSPEFLTVYNNALYFRASDGVLGSELWKYDGVGATVVSNINLGGDSFPKNLTVFKDELCFAANDGINGWELWRFDGVTASLVTNLNTAGDSFPEALTVFNGALYFVATTPTTGYEWWRYDGQCVTLAADINPSSGNSYPQFPAVFDRELCFSAADDGFSNWELWTLALAPFRITSIRVEGNDIDLSWSSLGGTTNIVQVSERVTGPYTNLGGPIMISGSGPSVTNFLDTNATEHAASRFYRIVQP